MKFLLVEEDKKKDNYLARRGDQEIDSLTNSTSSNNLNENRNELKETMNNGYRMDNGMIEDDYFTFERDNITYHFFYKPTRRTDKGQYGILAVDYGIRFDKEPYKDERGHTIIPMSRVHDKPQQLAYFEFNEDTHPEIAYAMTEDDRKEYRDLVVAETKKHMNEGLNEDLSSGAVDVNRFEFTNYRNPDGQRHPNCKTYRSTLEYMASETERLFNKCLKTYWGATEPYKQLTTEYMNLNRHSCIRDLVGASAEQGLKDAQSAIFKRQDELLELSKQFTKWNGKEWIKSDLTESNELEQRAKKHKKKSKGMGWHMAVNAGDVEKGIEVFNNSTGDLGSGDTGMSMGESIDDKLYYYDGPIYYRGHKITDVSDIYTTAKSLNVAIRNVLYKATKGDREELYHYEIVDDMVKEVSKKDIPKVNPKCPTCGYELNDIGDCPVCDYGEYDLLESLSDLEALWQLSKLD